MFLVITWRAYSEQTALFQGRVRRVLSCQVTEDTVAILLYLLIFLLKYVATVIKYTRPSKFTIYEKVTTVE